MLSHPETPNPESNRTLPAPEKLHQEQQDLKRMLALARAGDRSVLPELRDFLCRPGAVDQYGGNLAWDAMYQLVCLHAGQDLVVREALMEKLLDLQSALFREYENPTTAESLLIDRVVATWLHLHHLEMLYATLDDANLSRCVYYEKAISSAQKRYFAALDLLGRQRELAMPPVQLNLGNEPSSAIRSVTAAPPPNETPAPLG